MAKKKSIAEFIDEVGEDIYDTALTIAYLYTKGDARFVGLDKVRRPIAETAALNALGGNYVPNFLKDKHIAGTKRDMEMREFLTKVTEHTKRQLGVGCGACKATGIAHRLNAQGDLELYGGRCSVCRGRGWVAEPTEEAP